MKRLLTLATLVLSAGMGAQTFGGDALHRMLGGHAGCCEAPSCCEEPVCGCEVVDPACGVDSSGCCGAGPACHGHGRHRSLLDRLCSMKARNSCCEAPACCEAPSCCEEPACGCEVVDPACGCEAVDPACGVESCAPSCAPSYAGHCGPKRKVSVLDLFHGHRGHGCSSHASACGSCAPASHCGCGPCGNGCGHRGLLGRIFSCNQICPKHKYLFPAGDCCGHKHGGLLAGLFGHCGHGCGHGAGCCEAPSCCEDPVSCCHEPACGCEVADPACGCESGCTGSYAAPVVPAPAKKAPTPAPAMDEMPPMPPAPVVDPQAFVPGRGNYAQQTGLIIAR